MFSFIWHTFFFDPIYNGLIFLVDAVPHGDVGIAIIGLVVVAKILLLPLSLKASRTQFLMQKLEPKVREIKETFKDKKEDQARAMMKAYSDGGVNPFAGIALAFIQIPILFALYFSVYSGGGVKLPDVSVSLLYSFVPSPDIAPVHCLELPISV